MSNPTMDKHLNELQRIAAENDGVLTAEAVVEVARNPAHMFHGYFTWDDTEAAQKWRLQQGRQLIARVWATYQPEEEMEPVTVRAWVSLVPDRANGDSYRQFDAVMAAPPLREIYLKQCLKELNGLRRKYAAVKELSQVWAAIDQAQAEHSVDAPLMQMTTDAPLVPMAAD